MPLSNLDLQGARAALPAVVAPGDDDWDAARLFHSGIGDPDLVVRVGGVADVRRAIAVARDLDLPVVVRGGGHSAWGTLEGGVVVDLGALAGVEIVGEGAATVARVGGGATWSGVAAALAPQGLALSSGDTASVGVGGLTLGGGIGWMVRAWGLACDQLAGVQLVTATGEVIEATDASHPELMWALRGGGGNFGVVTRFDFHPHPLGAVAWAELTVSADARPVLAALRDLLATAPRELTVTFMDVPAMDPSAPAGATISACWAGADTEALRAALAPVLALDGVDEAVLETRPYPEILLDTPAVDPAQPLPGFIGGNTLVRELDDDAIDRMVAFRASSEASVLFLRSLGGAYADVPSDATAFAVRDASWFAMAGAFDIPGMVDDEARARFETAWSEIEQRGEGVYGNFSTSTDAAFAARMYPPETLRRLGAVKSVWDPGNLFSRNHNVVPT